MTGPGVRTPKNIFYFEVLLYLSLIIDSLSMLFRDDADLTEISAPVAKLFTAVLILFFVYLVWLAANRRQNWARMILLASLVLSVLSLIAVVSGIGWQAESVADFASSVLTALGLYFSFTGDARGWFSPPAGE